MSNAVAPPTPIEWILVLDFGSQYTQLIARRVRAAGVYCEIHSYDMANQAIRSHKPAGVILSGGPESTTVATAPSIPAAVFELAVPVLGICYGMQSMAQQLGGQVEPSTLHEFGYAKVMIEQPDAPLLQGIMDGKTATKAYLDVWMSHGDKVTALPSGFISIAATANAPIAAMMHRKRQLFGVQFHPEVTHTPQGQKIIDNFVLSICGCQKLWTSEHIIDAIVESIRTQVQSQDKVLLGLSGGVDSSVAAALLHKAIGDRLICIFVDNGLLRQNEGDAVMDMLSSEGDNSLQFNVKRVTAAEAFFAALVGLDEPEAKRKAIGSTFIDVFVEQAKQIDNVRWLGQGTIYSDVIESAAIKSGKAHVIKSHHNVGGLPEHMPLPLLEPLRSLFKDEVRQIGLALGLPETVVNRHPFPGPGLGVRVLGEVKPDYVKMLQAADVIFIEELTAANLYHQVSQAFAVLLPVKSVGVVGDTRRYQPVIALRAVETVDFMTAKWAELPHALLGHVANRIINELAGISRVVYDISGKPPATIEWE